MSAALLMANVQATLRARLSGDVKLAELAAHLDAEIDAATPGPMYLTAFIAVFDPDRRELRYVNAGHNPQFLVRAGRGIQQMGATGLPLALLPGQPYTEVVTHVHDGDMLFFYTAGVVEAENEAGNRSASTVWRHCSTRPCPSVSTLCWSAWTTPSARFAAAQSRRMTRR